MLTRREALLTSLAAPFLPSPTPAFAVAPFSAEVTVPPGHALMGGGVAPAALVEDPLFVHGLVFHGAGAPVVIASVDWCEIRNDALDAWRAALARAADTRPERVLVSSVHQHDAPIADLTAERLLRDARAAGRVCDPEFHARTVERVARAVRRALEAPRRVTHVGTGRAKVEKLASNRRYLLPASSPGGPRPAFGRTSATRDAYARDQPEGTIDPWLKTLSFWDGDTAVAALSCYATHPMSLYGRGAVSADFVGLARQRRQADAPGVHQVYLSGCSGNVTAGKYNDGAPANRQVLAERLYRGMHAAWSATRRTPLTSATFRAAACRLEPRDGPGFTLADLRARLTGGKRPFDQCLAALGLSWRRRADAGHELDVPALDLGVGVLVLLPGESYVEYQLHAQGLRPEDLVLAAGYGECATGYVPTEQAVKEGDTNLGDWCWVAPGAERRLKAATAKALGQDGRP